MINTWLRALVDLPLAVEILLKVTALLAAGWLLGLCLSHRNPRWRVFLWRGVSLGVLALPFLLLTIPRYDIPFETVAKSAPTASTPPAPAAEAVGEHVDATERMPRPTESLVPELATFFPAVPESSPGLVGWLHDHFFRVLGGIWIVVVLLLSFWALRSSLETRRLVRRSLPHSQPSSD